MARFLGWLLKSCFLMAVFFVVCRYLMGIEMPSSIGGSDNAQYDPYLPYRVAAYWTTGLCLWLWYFVRSFNKMRRGYRPMATIDRDAQGNCVRWRASIGSTVIDVDMVLNTLRFSAPGKNIYDSRRGIDAGRASGTTVETFPLAGFKLTKKEVEKSRTQVGYDVSMRQDMNYSNGALRPVNVQVFTPNGLDSTSVTGTDTYVMKLDYTAYKYTQIGSKLYDYWISVNPTKKLGPGAADSLLKDWEVVAKRTAEIEHKEMA